MSFNIEPPRQIFNMGMQDNINIPQESIINVDSVVTPKDKPVKKKFSGFSLSSFKSKVEFVPLNFEEQSLKDVVNNKNQENRNDLIFSHGLSKKRPYNQNVKIPSLLNTSRKAFNYSDILLSSNQRKQRELEEKVAKEDVMDMFGDVSMKSENDESESNSQINSAIAETLNKLMSYDIVLKKEKNSSPNVVLPVIFFSELYHIFKYLNPEERGKIIIHSIFGGLITRSKLTGTGGKSGISKFADLISTLSKLKIGASNTSEGKIYLQVKELILSSKLNKYRAESSASDQITNITSLIRKLVEGKFTVYFPTTITVSDPFQLKDTSGKILPNKTISLSGCPVILNLNNFFEKPKELEVNKIQSSKKKIYDEDDDGTADAEDRMTGSFGKKW